ncbi:hypothetical protein FRC07_002757 [Ceratobasidium sp. 392]|nr:hypothetical protein FRC07_002757 [Ceratobasidium sp. 392]
MILNDLSASIHIPEGEQLPELQTKKVNNNTIECWIPSTDGANFEIVYKSPNNARPNLSISCRPRLDGVDFLGNMLTAERVALGKSGKCRGQVTSTSSMRLFAFGKRLLTDNEAVAPSNGSSQKDLNIIQVKLLWGTAGVPTPQTYFEVPKENGPIHEKAAKKGHTASAGLGNSSNLECKPTCRHFEPSNLIEPLVFIFRYAPEDWLQAQGIMPSKTLSSQKRGRDPTPDIIDIDDLESDDDSVIVAKYLVPVTTSSSNKRQKVKDQDQVKGKQEP